MSTYIVASIYTESRNVLRHVCDMQSVNQSINQSINQSLY